MTPQPVPASICSTPAPVYSVLIIFQSGLFPGHSASDPPSRDSSVDPYKAFVVTLLKNLPWLPNAFLIKFRLSEGLMRPS